MPKYETEIEALGYWEEKKLICFSILDEVEANSEEDAIEIALENFKKADVDNLLLYIETYPTIDDVSAYLMEAQYD